MPHAATRASNRATVVWVQTLPSRGVGTPRSVSARAKPIAVVTPFACSSEISNASRCERIVALLDKSAVLTGKRVDAGRATKFDYVRIATLRDQRAALVPAIAAERQAALFRLATLTGRTPQDLPAAAAARVTTPRLDQPIPIGDGAGLLARRPDVHAAERRLAASTARIGVATADLYPHITLGGSAGVTGPSLGDLFSGGPVRWLVGPLLNWSLNQSAARAKIAGAKADTQAALASFDGSVLGALEETETALSTYARELDRRTHLQSARDNAATAARITQARQREGRSTSSTCSTRNAPSPMPMPIWQRRIRASPMRRSTCSVRSAAAGRPKKLSTPKRLGVWNNRQVGTPLDLSSGASHGVCDSPRLETSPSAWKLES